MSKVVSRKVRKKKSSLQERSEINKFGNEIDINCFQTWDDHSEDYVKSIVQGRPHER